MPRVYGNSPGGGGSGPVKDSPLKAIVYSQVQFRSQPQTNLAEIQCPASSVNQIYSTGKRAHSQAVKFLDECMLVIADFQLF
jgi:hypothetical protein